MEEENTTEGCPICLCDYTTLGDHRVVSLKCGHLFGQQCIYSWFNRKKSALCPKCCLKSKESDIRPIFANKIVAIDSVREEESIRELNIERKLRSELQLEITKLKTTINYLNSELIKKQESIVKEKSNFLHKRFFKKFNTKINKNSLMVYEKMNDFLLISYFENKLGIKKINTFGLKSVEFFSVADFFIDNSLKEIKINPFNDGTFGIIYDNSFKLFTSYNNKEIFHFCHDTKLTSFSFDQQFRNIIFLGTEDGKVLVYDLDKKRIEKEYSVTDCSIHSIYKMEEEIYCAGFKGVFLIKDNEVSRVEKRGYPVCTNLFSDDNNILGIFRDGNMAVMHYLINTDVCINLNRIHFRRNRDKIYDNFLFTIDDTKRDIIVFDFVKWKIIYKYEVNDPIIDFVSTNEKFFLLTEGGIHIFID